MVCGRLQWAAQADIIKAVREMDLSLYVESGGGRVPVEVLPAGEADLAQTKGWQTFWQTGPAAAFPNKVALKRKDDGELLGLMSYSVEKAVLAVEIIYIESAAHSNANLLQAAARKKYTGVAKALFAHAIRESVEAGFGGTVIFKAKSTELMEYYMREFGAQPVGRYNPLQLVIWDDAAKAMVAPFLRGA